MVLPFPNGSPHMLALRHVLPLTSTKRATGPTCGLTRRVLRFTAFFAVVVLSTVFFILPRWQESPVLATPRNRLPPLYEDFRAREQRLPHYEIYETNRSVKYFWAAQHAHSSGWGNVMQDYIMMGLLAHATGRSFVFDDYIWNPNGQAFSDYKGKLIPSRTPLSALLSGPMVGGAMPPGDNTPLSVNRQFFQRVCPNSTVLRVSDVNSHEMRFGDSIPATYVFDKWVETINAVEDPCLMLDPSGNQVFEIWIFGKKERMLPLWPTIYRSPVLTSWNWSPLIHAAYRRNRHLFKQFPSPTSRLTALIEALSLSGPEDPSTMIKGLLAVHIRRGDFEEHCRNLAVWDADWNAWNSFPEFIDHFEQPRGVSPDEVMNYYLERCYPSIQQIVNRVRRVREESLPKYDLKYLYIMTNGPDPWVRQLQVALAEDGDDGLGPKWESVKSSLDLDLTWQEKFVAQGLDMFVAQRAEVIIGNGWSSLTSNVVALRLAHGFPTDSIRFW